MPHYPGKGGEGLKLRRQFGRHSPRSDHTPQTVPGSPSCVRKHGQGMAGRPHDGHALKGHVARQTRERGHELSRAGKTHWSPSWCVPDPIRGSAVRTQGKASKPAFCGVGRSFPFASPLTTVRWGAVSIVGGYRSESLCITKAFDLPGLSQNWGKRSASGRSQTS